MPRRNGALTVPCPTSSGLRNKRRSGRSTYSVQRKSREADRYGQVRDGRCTDTIAGCQVTWKASQESVQTA